MFLRELKRKNVIFLILSKSGKELQYFVLVASNYWMAVTPTKFGGADFKQDVHFWNFK